MSRPVNRLVRGDGSHASRGSFHAGAPIMSVPPMRRQPTHRYQTFPTTPPKTPLEPPTGSPVVVGDDGSDSGDDDDDDDHDDGDATPLPVRQLLLLAFLSLAEQTALNSIGPYLPEMVASMPGIPAGEGGLYVGILASSFALAQLSTNLFWGYASDVVGRKPVLLLGTAALIGCFCVFGLCRAYWQVVIVHVAMGMLNGNAACVPTVLGEVTDRSNQSRAFIYLPIMYSLGGITSPAVGGVLVGKLSRDYPYLAPNVLAAALLTLSFTIVAIWFEETLEEPASPAILLPSAVTRFAAWLRRHSESASQSSKRSESWSARWPRAQGDTRPLLSSSSSTSSADRDSDSEGEEDHIGPERPPWRELLNKTTLILLGSYLMFQLSNISFNSLYPIFAATPPPTGRGLKPGTIGVSLSLAGVATIIFQSFLFQPVKAKLGNLGAFKFALFGIAVSMVLMPWVGYLDDEPYFGLGSGKAWLFAELGVVLILKNICAVGGLSCVMLLITNSAPSHASLGTLNGVAQTLSALGRSIGPFASGGLFTLSAYIRPKGEALAWSIFGGLALVGWLGSLFIHGEHLESDDWVGNEEDEDDEEDREDDAV